MKPALQIPKQLPKQRATVYLKPANREILFAYAKRSKVSPGAVVDALVEERLK